MNNVIMLGLQLRIEISIAKTSKIQTMWININERDSEEYYEMSVNVPFHENLINPLHSKV